MSDINFSFDDIVYKGHQGEPMAAALLRNGLLSITNSTYHGRPRSVIGQRGSEKEWRVRLAGTG